MALKWTRRAFLKKSALAAAALHLPPQSSFAALHGPKASSRRRGFQETPTVCAMCAARCLITGKTRDGKLVKIDGSPGNPLNGGTICARGQAAVQLLYDPDRLKYPLKRVGPRGSGQWTRISWGEAIDAISLRMEKALHRDGPESLALFCKGPSAVYIRELFKEFAVPHINNSSYENCVMNRDLAYRLTFGFSPGAPPRLDYPNTRCIVLMGSHMGENIHVPELKRLLEALDRGAKLIVADPRISAMAAKADHHLMIRPGTDTALLLGWINYIIESGQYDVGYVARYVEGFAALRQQASRYPVDRVAEITDIPPDEIRRTARVMAQSAPATIIHPGNHSNWYGDDVQRLRARAILAGLLGTWGRKGGMLPPATLPGQARETETAFERGRQAVEEALEDQGTRGAAIFRKMEAGAIKIVGCWGQNPFHGFPNPYNTLAAFKGADFVFACDVLPSEATLYADIILPEAIFLERADVIETWPGSDPAVLATRFPVVPPRFEAKDPYWIVKQLSVRLGRGAGFSFADVSERLQSELSAFGVTLTALRRQGGFLVLPAKQDLEARQLHFPTASGKIDFSSRFLAKKGYSPVPEYVSPPAPPAGFFRLLYGRSPVHTGSGTQNNPWLHHEMPENELWLNEAVAEILGIGEGDGLLLENQDGIRSLKTIRVKVTPGIRKECVYMVHGFGCRSRFLHLAFDQGVSDASLMTRSTLNTLTGSRGLRNTFVRLVKDGKPIAFVWE